MKKQKIFLIVYFSALLILSVLPIFIFWKSAGLTIYSIPAIICLVSSVVYAAIAYSLRDRINLFLIGTHRLYFIFRYNFFGDDSKRYTSHPYYKKEIFISGIIFGSTIPFYIPIAFFSCDFYSAMRWILSLCLIWVIIALVFAISWRIVTMMKMQKQEKMQDVNDRIEQEKRESSGKWK